MNSFESILILQGALAAILAITLMVVVWRLAKAGGSVEITLPSIKVMWGNRQRSEDRGQRTDGKAKK